MKLNFKNSFNQQKFFDLYLGLIIALILISSLFFSAPSYAQNLDLSNQEQKQSSETEETDRQENKTNNEQSINLKQLIELIFSNSEQIAIAKEQQKQTELSAKNLDSTFLPHINASLGTSQTKNFGSNSTGSTGSENSSTANIELSQKIWQPLSSDVSSEKAKLLRQLADLTYRQTESELIKQASVAFLQVLKASYQIDFAKTTFKGAEDTLKTARVLLESGQSSGLELLRSQSAFNVAKAELLVANQTYSKALITLGNLVDLKIENISNQGINLLEIMAHDFSQSHDDWLEKMGENNLALKIAFLNQKLATLELKSAEKKYAPELELKASSTQFINDSSPLNRDNSSTIGLSFSIPLYQAGRKQTLLETNQSILTETQLGYDLLKTELRYQLTDLEQKGAYLKQLIIAYDKAQQSLKSSLEKTIEAYQSGASEVNEVNEATTNFAASELQFKVAKIDKIINFIELYHLLGSLTKQKVIGLL